MYFATRPRPALTAVIAGVLIDGTGGGINGKAMVFKGLFIYYVYTKWGSPCDFVINWAGPASLPAIT